MRASPTDEPIVDINVTPLVDVTLVLLIIFLATSYLIAQQSLKVQLPKAARTTATEARTVAVMVEANGNIRLDDQLVNADQLLTRLQTLKAERPNLQVLVGADRETRHGKVIEVMDAARQAGIEGLAFAVERR